ncbi:rRNA adenine N(6)-methyltransferase family protein [Cellulosimicrobium cellulans]|uniref:rRNA adenine N(6)-methyltransferase family protein n=1 Tax=Cellulosimicrobium cellulans TaxID=1710 RepID=UPI0037F10F61
MAGPASRREWGWHPLTAEHAARVVDDAGVLPGQLVLDLGAGDGALTRHLVAAGARVLAVELHPRRARTLRERFAGAEVTVLEVDLVDLRLPRRPFRVVANPPFGLTSPLLARVLARGSALVAADVVVQRQAARRIAAGEGTAGRAARGWAVEVGRPVPRSAFRPPPRVDAAVLRVRRGRR